MVKVLLVHGGDFSEREVSLKSSYNVQKALSELGYGLTVYDPLKDGSIEPWLKNVDVVFPMIHGQGGEDGSLQKQLEDYDIPFVGSGSQSSANCFDKFKTFKQVSDILLPKTALVRYEDFIGHKLNKFPFVLKPAKDGSSVDTFMIKSERDLKAINIQQVFKNHNKMIIQEHISGVEITVPVLINKALPVIEIIPPAGQDFDYLNKYNGKTQELCPPKNVSIKNQKLAQKLALKVHKKMGCRGFSRSDFIIDVNNNIYFLEINTIPGMTEQSLFPKSALQAGYSMPDATRILVENALSS
ncbi:D-alanine--D-alanine ligase [Candidatus Saccharibacteria bacterium]|nr:D-alanine--D-alanine ligase [Candidatus Saccharibacteria bacterium]